MQTVTWHLEDKAKLREIQTIISTFCYTYKVDF